MNMKMNQTHPLRNMRYVVATVRAMIERQYSSFAEQQIRLFRSALNEAEALAWETGFPHLVFPTLAMEKVRSLAEGYERRKCMPRGESLPAFAA
jgi:hypothetical protein